MTSMRLAIGLRPKIYHYHHCRVVLHASHIPLNNSTRASGFRFTSNMPPKPKLETPDPPLDTPSLEDKELCYSYEIARGEMGVLSFEPYKSLILPYWAFRTVPIATNSAEVLWSIFRSYIEREDFVGADMTRKYIQMGMTRARRYANHKGGRKYGKDGKVLKKWDDDDVDGKRKEKEEASEIFKGYWRRCTVDEEYKSLKEEWQKAKASFQKSKKDVDD